MDQIFKCKKNVLKENMNECFKNPEVRKTFASMAHILEGREEANG